MLFSANVSRGAEGAGGTVCDQDFKDERYGATFLVVAGDKFIRIELRQLHEALLAKAFHLRIEQPLHL